VIAPDTPGRFTLKAMPVQEHVAWFDNIDPRNTAQCRVEVVESQEKLERPTESVLATAL
jgi:hypothetical protein